MIAFKNPTIKGIPCSPISSLRVLPTSSPLNEKERTRRYQRFFERSRLSSIVPLKTTNSIIQIWSVPISAWRKGLGSCRTNYRLLRRTQRSNTRRRNWKSSRPNLSQGRSSQNRSINSGRKTPLWSYPTMTWPCVWRALRETPNSIRIFKVSTGRPSWCSRWSTWGPTFSLCANRSPRCSSSATTIRSRPFEIGLTSRLEC